MISNGKVGRKIIDTHIHVFPDDLAEKAVKIVCTSRQIPAYSDGKVTTLLEQMSKWGIESSFILGVATKPEHVFKINHFLSGTALAHPQLIPIGALHPRFKDNLAEIEEAKSLGIKGFKLHSHFQNFLINDPGMNDVYKLLEEKGLPVIFHTGVEPQGEVVKAMPQDFLRLRGRFKNLKIVLAHLGGNYVHDVVEEEIAGQDFYLDTSYVAEYISPEQFERIIKKHGAERVLFATDTPWGDIEKQLNIVEQLGVSDKAKELIFSKNAEDLFKIR